MLTDCFIDVSSTLMTAPFSWFSYSTCQLVHLGERASSRVQSSICCLPRQTWVASCPPGQQASSGGQVFSQLPASVSRCREVEYIFDVRVGPGDPGTVFPALNDGFLCVISLLSTFLRPLVTSSPRLSSANTAATPPAAGAGVGAVGGVALNSSTVGPCRS